MSHDNKPENHPSTPEETKPTEPVGIPQDTEPHIEEQKTGLPSRLWSVVPGLVILLSALIYINYDRNFIQCLGNEGEQCRKLEGSLISRVDDPMDISNANKRISETNPILSNTQIRIGDLTNQMIETKSSITNTSQQLAKAKKEKREADVQQLTNSKTSLDEVLAAQNSEMESLTKKKEVAEAKLAGIQKQLSKRYANRMLWVFLTGVSFILSIAAIVIALFAIYNSLRGGVENAFHLKSYFVPVVLIILTSVTAYLFASNAYANHERYMSVILPMYNQSLLLEGSSLIENINLINVLAFAVIIFLVVASCSILYKVQATARNTAFDVSEKALAYEISKKYLQAILYVGAAMLVCGIFRAGVIQEWHLSFISGAPESMYYTSLRTFFENSLKVQAGFYSILLAVIYFPTAYWIKQNVAALKLDATETSDKGLSFSLTDFLPKLISVFSPVLAAPLASFVGQFFGSN